MFFYDNFVKYVNEYSEDSDYNEAYLLGLNVTVVLLLVLNVCTMAGAVHLLATTQPLKHPVYCIIFQGRIYNF